MRKISAIFEVLAQGKARQIRIRKVKKLTETAGSLPAGAVSATFSDRARKILKNYALAVKIGVVCYLDRRTYFDIW
jgi:hypothetical protein